MRGQYERQAASIAAEIGNTHGSNVLLSLLAHSDDDRGDLMIGISRRKKLEVASTVAAVLEILFTPFENIVSGSMLVMFACGAVINEASSFEQFRHAITHYE